MSSVISAALAYLASWFQSRHAMQLEILALKHQLAVYQHRVKRPQLQPADRLFWAWLSQLWSGWQQVLEFVQPRTVIAWQKKRFRDYWRRLSESGRPGRPTLSKEVRELIQDMWRCNPTWGSPRIVGELHKIGIDVAKSTVEAYRPVLMALNVVDGINHTSCSRSKDITESESSCHQSGLHGGCPNHHTEFQRTMRSDEVVEAPNQLEMFRQVLISTGMTEAATAQIRTTVPHR
jgi:hypothetical protein